MIREQTRLNVADNTGAKKVMCIRILGGSRKKSGKIGDIIVVTVKSAIPGGSVKKGELSFYHSQPHQFLFFLFLSFSYLFGPRFSYT